MLSCDLEKGQFYEVDLNAEETNKSQNTEISEKGIGESIEGIEPACCKCLNFGRWVRFPLNTITSSVLMFGGISMLLGGSMVYVSCDDQKECFSSYDDQNVGIGLISAGGVLLTAGTCFFCSD